MAEEAAVLAEEAAAHGEDERIVEDRVTAGWRLVGELFGGQPGDLQHQGRLLTRPAIELSA